MPHFTLALDSGGGGPIINAYVAVSQPREQALKNAGLPVPNRVVIRALIDTGASGTCIDPTALAPLGLTPTGQIPLLTPSTGPTPVMADQYDVSLIIPGATASTPPLIIPALPVLKSDLDIQGIQALIGRDILADCILNYHGSVSMFSLAY